MNIDYIYDFIKVAEYKSLNKASHTLNISTPALSKRINSIEDYFNSVLFIRTVNGIFLNEQGEIVLDLFKKINKSIESTKFQINDHQSEILKIGVIPSFSLIKLQNNYKDSLSTIVIENSTSILLEKLNKGYLDVIIGDITNINNADIVTQEIYQEEFVIVFPIDSKIKYEHINSIHQLQNEMIYIQSPPCDTFKFLDDNVNLNKLNVMYKENYESILANIKANKGITVMPNFLSKEGIDTLNLSINHLRDKRIVGVASYDRNKLREIYKLIK